MKQFLSLVVAASLGLFSVTCAGDPASKAPGQVLVVPVGASGFKVLRSEDPYLDLDFIGWGPNWSWAGWEGTSAAENGATRIRGTMRLSTGATLSLDGTARREGTRDLALDLTLKTDKDTDLTGVMLAVGADGDAFKGGKVMAAGGSTLALPLQMQGLGDGVTRFEMTDAGGESTAVTLAPATRITSDGAIRIVLADQKMAAATPIRKQIRFQFPAEVKQLLSAADVPDETAAWFEFLPSAAPTGVDEASLANWLEKPAGRRGRVVAKGDQLTVGGEPIKLWGLNVCYATCAPPKELAEARARFYARHGINAVRLHKYADGTGWAGIQSERSFAEFDAAALDRMDYFVAKLKEAGIYVKLSPTFGVKLGVDDQKAVPYLAEFGAIPKPGDRLETKHGAVFLAKELQDLQIAQTTNLLKHRNPYTGLTYGADPAVAIVEFYNEDSALFYGTMDRLQNIPTLRARTGTAFTAWLKQRYGTKAKLLAAWGEGGLNTFVGEGFTNESWEDGTILPVGNPWFFDPAQLSGSQKPRARRLLDAMEFLTGLQNQFYDRFTAAVRKAGYAGELIGSNWIAGRGFSHFYNLHSDSRVGMIDRHNYFGGGNGSRFDDRSMLSQPGSGMFSTGLNQVANRPFSLSEWIHVFPSEWGAEGPAIMGAYGMGLQGWDVSFIFQNNDNGTYSDRIGRDQWDAVAPQLMGLFPAVSRQVLRGDVSESKLVIPRNVHVPSLSEGKLGFEDFGEASGDVKSSDSSAVPAAALAVGRAVVDFTAKYTTTPKFDMTPHVKNGQVLASTGQLGWALGDSAKAGWFWMNTPGTQAVVGFASGQTAKLADVEISPTSRFSAVYVSARDRGATLKTGKAWLITAVARARNTGMQIVGPVLLDAGRGPIRMEPVVVDLNINRPGAKVTVLDADGRRTNRSVPVSGGKVRIDTARDKSISYLVEFQ